ncbi:hypothetical protein [Subsaximicrobium wynnwilliamsii]|nr:hypothetical protein [Subsaximicrobium wynnwilliamsii]
MNFLNFVAGKGGFMILALIVIALFMYRKYKSERYFKEVEKRINNRKKQ